MSAVTAILGIVFVVLGLFGLWYTYDTILFNKHCIGVMGTLDNKYTKHCRGFACDYYIQYTFIYEGVEYKGSDTIDDEPITRDVPIFFLPGNPSKNKGEKGGVLKTLLSGIFCLYVGIFQLNSLKK